MNKISLFILSLIEIIFKYPNNANKGIVFAPSPEMKLYIFVKNSSFELFTSSESSSSEKILFAAIKSPFDIVRSSQYSINIIHISMK